jgi:hypothetical protein
MVFEPRMSVLSSSRSHSVTGLGRGRGALGTDFSVAFAPTSPATLCLGPAIAERVSLSLRSFAVRVERIPLDLRG